MRLAKATTADDEERRLLNGRRGLPPAERVAVRANGSDCGTTTIRPLPPTTAAATAIITRRDP